MLGKLMEAEIAEQPALLAANRIGYRDQLKGLDSGEIECIVLAARGSSDHAALFGRYLFEIKLGLPVILAAPSVITKYRAEVRFPKALVVGISQSGAAPDVAEVLEYMRARGHKTLAITNTLPSRLSQVAEATLDLRVGEERSVAATKTYTATLLALCAICEALGGKIENVARFPNQDWILRCQEEAGAGVEAVVAGDPVFSLGRGYAFATAMESALKLMECALIPCKAYSTADFEHGPKALADDSSTLIAYSPVSEPLRLQGARIVEAPQVSGIGEVEAVFWDSIFAQWLALACARHRGLDPDKPQFIRKVTQTR